MVSVIVSSIIGGIFGWAFSQYILIPILKYLTKWFD